MQFALFLVKKKRQFPGEAKEEDPIFAFTLNIHESCVLLQQYSHGKLTSTIDSQWLQHSFASPTSNARIFLVFCLTFRIPSQLVTGNGKLLNVHLTQIESNQFFSVKIFLYSKHQNPHFFRFSYLSLTLHLHQHPINSHTCATSCCSTFAYWHEWRHSIRMNVSEVSTLFSSHATSDRAPRHT